MKKTLDEFSEYIEQTRSMGYEEEPDYEALRGLFHRIMQRNGYTDDKMFDWILKKNNQPINVHLFLKFFIIQKKKMFIMKIES